MEWIVAVLVTMSIWLYYASEIKYNQKVLKRGFRFRWEKRKLEG